MAPKVAVEKMKNLIISSTEKGCQDNHSLLDVYKRFDKYLSNNNIQRPIVMLADGHSSRFDYKVLHFLREKQLHLYITPPDTTGVTQLLDQSPNQNLHREYNKAKEKLFTAFQTINRENFMSILGEMWDKWASEDIIINAAKRVGISTTGLNVNDMQQDKFEQALNCMSQVQENDSRGPSTSTPKKVSTRSSQRIMKEPTTPRSLSKIAQTKHRYGSAGYWKFMFEQSQQLIKESYQTSLKLEEVPGLLTINKVKPKDITKRQHTRVTNVHGSMEAQDILAKVKSIEKEKNEKEHQKEKKKEQKVEEREAFYKCKSKCICNGICSAKGLKECPICHEIKRSVCSKASCRISGKKPTMILPATTDYFDDGSNSDIEEYDSSDSEVAMSDDSDAINEPTNDEFLGDKSASEKMVSTWKKLSPPVIEKDIIGKWFAGIYETKKVNYLCIGRLLKRFLDDENGDVNSVEMRCLKPKIAGSGTVMEDTPDHLPDIGIFKIYNIIDGPLKVTPLRGKKWDIPNYEKINHFFQEASTLDRVSLKNSV